MEQARWIQSGGREVEVGRAGLDADLGERGSGWNGAGCRAGPDVE